MYVSCYYIGCKCCTTVQETRILVKYVWGKHTSVMVIRISSDMCVGEHRYLGMHVWKTLYLGKCASLWQWKWDSTC